MRPSRCVRAEGVNPAARRDILVHPGAAARYGGGGAQAPRRAAPKRWDNVSNDKTCIYCPQTDPSRFRGVEHVIPQGFGRFGSETPTLDCVCDDCNAYFRRELDQLLARETYEGSPATIEASSLGKRARRGA